jgi:hypothetical protein
VLTADETGRASARVGGREDFVLCASGLGRAAEGVLAVSISTEISTIPSVASISTLGGAGGGGTATTIAGIVTSTVAFTDGFTGAGGQAAAGAGPGRTGKSGIGMLGQAESSTFTNGQAAGNNDSTSLEVGEIALSKAVSAASAGIVGALVVGAAPLPDPWWGGVP